MIQVNRCLLLCLSVAGFFLLQLFLLAFFAGLALLWGRGFIGIGYRGRWLGCWLR